MVTLGRVETVALRDIWTHEARDFSTWLAQESNLALLSDTIGIEMEFSEREASVGDFSVDLSAQEVETGRRIIIENQLEDTNHDHLGKIITYASGMNAEVIIWIVKRARDEHKQAINWLNQHTDQNIGFFLVEIEVIRIGQSEPAPRFKIIERPNDWSKSMRISEGLSPTKKLQLAFWQSFSEYAFSNSDFSNRFSKRKAQPQHWYDVSIGRTGVHISLTVNTQKNLLGAELYFHEDRQLFLQIKSNEQDIRDMIGLPIKWVEAEKASRMLITEQADIKKDNTCWNKHFTWFMEKAVQLKDVFSRYAV